MKKKFFALILAGIFIISMLAGCSSGANKKPDGSGGISAVAVPTTPSQNNSSNAQAGNSPASTPAAKIPGYTGTPSEAFGKYTSAKSAAYQRISDKIKGNSNLALLVGMPLLGVVTVDLGLMPLTAVGLDSKGGSAALSMLGLQNVNIKQDGSVYTITYTDNKGNGVTQTCEYDSSAGSMKSDMQQNGQDFLYFEFVKIGDGYASQYSTYDENSGEYSLIKCYVDSNISAFGLSDKLPGNPPTIYKNTGLTQDFVKDCGSYYILEGDKLTVFDNGTTNTY